MIPETINSHANQSDMQGNTKLITMDAVHLSKLKNSKSRLLI
jgi:hypothetical protein